MSPTVEPLDACAPGAASTCKVALAREALPPDEVIEEISGIFKVLGDPTRARLLYTLLDAGELCVCDLAEATQVAETTVSQALRLMRSAGVVVRRRAGRNVFYRISDGHVRMLLDVTRAHIDHDASEA